MFCRRCSVCVAKRIMESTRVMIMIELQIIHTIELIVDCFTYSIHKRDCSFNRSTELFPLEQFLQLRSKQPRGLRLE
jgi:hypothetical protein